MKGDVTQACTLCLSHVPQWPQRRCSGKHWLDSGCLHQWHHTRRAKTGPVPVAKRQTQVVIINLTRLFAEVGSSAALAQCIAPTLRVRCSAPMSPGPCVSGESQCVPMGCVAMNPSAPPHPCSWCLNAKRCRAPAPSWGAAHGACSAQGSRREAALVQMKPDRALLHSQL